MKTLILTFKLVFLLWIVACASKYGPRGSMGGYEERLVGQNMMEVRFYGNQHTSESGTIQMLLYRCAELTKKNGFNSFVVLQDQSYKNELVNDPTLDQPFETRESVSMGVRTVVMPDLTQPTSSTNFIGVYTISMFNEGDPSYSKYARSRLDAEQILKDYKRVIR